MRYIIPRRLNADLALLALIVFSRLKEGAQKLRHAQQGRSREHHKAVARHCSEKRLDVNAQVALFVEPHNVFRRALKRVAPLVVGLECHFRNSAGSMIDEHGLQAIGNAGLRGSTENLVLGIMPVPGSLKLP